MCSMTYSSRKFTGTTLTHFAIDILQLSLVERRFMGVVKFLLLYLPPSIRNRGEGGGDPAECHDSLPRRPLSYFVIASDTPIKTLHKCILLYIFYRVIHSIQNTSPTRR